MLEILMIIAVFVLAVPVGAIVIGVIMAIVDPPRR